MELFTHDGVQIAHEEAGSGPAIVFLHNGGASSTIWRHQATALADRYRTVVVDLPGFGCSPRADDGVDLAGHVELLAALLDHLEITDALAVGNCMGSTIAAAIAEARPDLVAGLVLINPLTEATFSRGPLGLLHRMERFAPGPTRVARNVARHVVPPKLAAVATVRWQLGAKGAAQDLQHDDALVRGNRRTDQLPALIDVLDDMRDYALLDQSWTVGQVPVCTVWGAQNRVLSPAAGRTLDERLQPVRTERIERCGHLVMLEDPDTVTAIIRECADAFLSERATSATGPVTS